MNDSSPFQSGQYPTLNILVLVPIGVQCATLFPLTEKMLTKCKAIVPKSRIPKQCAQWVQFLKWRPVNKLDQTLSTRRYSCQPCFFVQV